MNSQSSRRNPHDWLLNSQFAPHVDAFTHYLTERRYAPVTVSIYLGCLAHFAHWMSHIGADIRVPPARLLEAKYFFAEGVSV